MLVKQLAADEAIAAPDTLLLTVPNQLGVDYNALAIESILKFVAPELGCADPCDVRRDRPTRYWCEPPFAPMGGLPCRETVLHLS